MRLLCKNPRVRGSISDKLREPFRVMEGIDAETASRTISHLPEKQTQWNKFLVVMQGLRDVTTIPSLLAKTYPNSWGKVVPVIQNAMQNMHRDQSRYWHAVAEGFDNLGFTRHSETDGMIGVLKVNIKKSLFIGDGENAPKTIPQIRSMIIEASKGSRDLFDVIGAHRHTDPTPAGMAVYRRILQDADWTLTDRHLNAIKQMIDSENYSRNLGIANFRKGLAKQGIPAADWPELVKKSFSDDLDSYAPLMREHMAAALASETEHGRVGINYTSFYGSEKEKIDQVLGLEGMDDHLEGGIREIGLYRAQAKSLTEKGLAPPPFEFSAPEGLGLTSKTYATSDEALGELVGLQHPAHPALAGDTPALTAARQNKHVLFNSLNSNIDAYLAQKNPSLIAGLIHVPQEVRVRFYERRFLSRRSFNASARDMFDAYMSATLKFAHIQPALDEIVPMMRAIKSAVPDAESRSLIHYINMQAGNVPLSTRANLRAVVGISKLFYLATLGGNVSAGVADWLGQTGFIIAEFGLRPWLAATRALGDTKHGPMIHRLLFDAGVGWEARAGGIRAEKLQQGLKALREAESIEEAVKHTANFGISALDVFGRVENRLHQVSYLTGIIDWLAKAGVWKPGMATEEMDKAFDVAMATNEDAIKAAGNRAIAKAAFLFGTLDDPIALSYLKQEPTGIGRAASMFTNYPIQSTQRIASWVVEMGRLRRNINDEAGRAAAQKLFRFFAYGTVVAGPFFVVPFLRDLRSSGDTDSAARLRNYFVAWEKNFSVGGLMGHLVKTVGGDAVAPDFADQLTPDIFKLASGQLTQTALPHGPILAMGANIFNLTSGDPVVRSKARESFIGGELESRFSGMGNPSKPFPMGLATMIPNGVATFRALNSAVAFALGAQLDPSGALLQPTSVSREMIRQFSRPLDEVLVASEGRLANREAETRLSGVMQLKRAALDGNSALVGKLLTGDPTLAASIEPSDMLRLQRDRNLVPQARAALGSALPLAEKTFARVVRRLSEGGLSPAEEFEAWQIFAVLVYRFSKMRGRGTIDPLNLGVRQTFSNRINL